MIKLYTSNMAKMSALISDSGNKAACEAEITEAATNHLGGSLPFLYSKGAPFSILSNDQAGVIRLAGIQEIGEKEAAQIQAAFVAG